MLKAVLFVSLGCYTLHIIIHSSFANCSFANCMFKHDVSYQAYSICMLFLTVKIGQLLFAD